VHNEQITVRGFAQYTLLSTTIALILTLQVLSVCHSATDGDAFTYTATTTAIDIIATLYIIPKQTVSSAKYI
jgi:hypothetical protein